MYAIDKPQWSITKFIVPQAEQIEWIPAPSSNTCQGRFGSAICKIASLAMNENATHLCDSRPSSPGCGVGGVWSWFATSTLVVLTTWREGISIKCPFCVPCSLLTWLYFLIFLFNLLHLPLPFVAACSPEWVPTVRKAGILRREKDEKELRCNQRLDSLRPRTNLSESGKHSAKTPEAISDRVHRPALVSPYVLYLLSRILTA